MRDECGKYDKIERRPLGGAAGVSGVAVITASHLSPKYTVFCNIYKKKLCWESQVVYKDKNTLSLGSTNILRFSVK